MGIGSGVGLDRTRADMAIFHRRARLAIVVRDNSDWRQAEMTEVRRTLDEETEREQLLARLSQRDQEKPMHIGTLSSSKYLKQSDFPKPKLLTIDHVTVEDLARPGEPKKERGVMYFTEVTRGLVLNKTNINRCASIFGSQETEDWAGKQVVVYFDRDVEMSGQLVGGLRVRGPKPTAQQQSRQSPVLGDRGPMPIRTARDQTPMGEIQGMDNDVPF